MRDGVNNYEERFLFPFHRIPKDSRIVIYGAGNLGQSYIKQILLTGWCQIVSVVDARHSAYDDFVVPVRSVKELPVMNFDYLVMAIRSEDQRKNILQQPELRAIPSENIVYQERQEEISLFRQREEEPVKDMLVRAVQPSGKNIQIFADGGIGDKLVDKKVLEVLADLDPGIRMDVFCDVQRSYMEFLVQDLPQVRIVAWEMEAGRKEDSQDEYACILRLSAIQTITVEFLADPHPFSEVLGRALQTLQKMPQESSNLYEMRYRNIYRGEKFYTKFSYDGILPFHHPFVHIPSDPAAEKRVRSMSLGRYVTMNFGNGQTVDASAISKAWPKENFEAVISLLHQNNPNLKVVQLGANCAERLEGADVYVLGKPFSIVSEILRHSLLHIDIEGGLVHVATHLGTKCIVLFGPTQMVFYGYPENINIRVGKCHDCSGLYKNDIYHCARGMRKPSCMYDITPEMVMEHVKEYLGDEEWKEQ